MVAFVLADAYREKFGGDHVDDVLEAVARLRGAHRVAAALKPALVFIGFMGAGKSCAAREAAAALGVPVDDADALLEARLGEPIQAFFARDGEAAFRARRGGAGRRAARDAPTAASIALGGGALGSERVRAALERHRRGAARRRPRHGVGARRARADARWRATASAFAALYRRARPLYDAAADAVAARDRRAASWRARSTALQAMPEGHRLLWATSASGDYPVWVGPLERAPWPGARAARS